MSKKLILGITGGIGSGKSYVAAWFNANGVPVFDCDSEAKLLTCTHPGIRTDLEQLVGKEVYEGNNLQKKVLADYLFASPEHTQAVNAVIHPRVAEAFAHWVVMHEDCRLLAMESAILFESGFNGLVHRVLLVTAPITLRIERVMKRDGVSRAEVERRMRAQINEEEKRRKAHFVIENDGSRQIENELRELTDTLLEEKTLPDNL